MFARSMNWFDDPVMEKMPLRRKQLQLAMFALHLFTGHSITCRQIKANTIRAYLRAVATFMQLFGNQQMDCHQDHPLDKSMGILLTRIFAEIDRYDGVPHRKEPFTVEMLDFALDLAAALGEDPDSYVLVLADWYIVGLNAGLRKAEWAQPEDKQLDPECPELNEKEETKAFCLNDIRIETVKMGRRRHLYTGAACLKVHPNQVRKMWIKFKTQKNGEHGEERMFTRTEEDGRRCFIQAVYRILKWFVCLRGAKDVTTPLGLYVNSDGEVVLITPKVIKKHMREIASKVYSLDPVKDADKLQKWSSHSIHVGACVLLHSLGYTETQLKWLLRWKSDAFMAYLRNMAGLADKQSQALNKASGMPNFF